MSNQTVKDVMTEYAPRLRPGMELSRAVAILLKDDESGTPVVDDDRMLVGMLSESDCLKVFFGERYHKRPSATVADLMATDVSVVHREEPLRQVAERFLKTGFRCFPVVDDARTVLGLVRRRDLLAAMCKSSPLERDDDTSAMLEERTRQGPMITDARSAREVVGPETNKRFQ